LVSLTSATVYSLLYLPETLNPTANLQIVTLLRMFELLKFSYIIYVTSDIRTFCHFRLFRPELYPTTQQSVFHVPEEEEEITISAAYKLNILLYEKRRCVVSSCWCKVRSVDCTWSIKLLVYLKKFKSSTFQKLFDVIQYNQNSTDQYFDHTNAR
jgi:hypothetical protein